MDDCVFYRINFFATFRNTREIYKNPRFLSEIGIRERYGYEIRKGDIAWNLWKNGHKLRNIDRGNKFISLAPTLPQIAHTLSKTYLLGEIGSLFSQVIACTRLPSRISKYIRMIMSDARDSS